MKNINNNRATEHKKNKNTKALKSNRKVKKLRVSKTQPTSRVKVHKKPEKEKNPAYLEFIEWWINNADDIPAIAAACRKVLLSHPSSAAAEKIFFPSVRKFAAYWPATQ